MATYINNSPARNIDPKIKENEFLKENNYHLKEEIGKLSAHIEYLTGLLQKNVCEKCGNIGTMIKMGSIEDRMHGNKFQKAITETDSIDGMKLPKFSTIPEPKISSKPTLSN
jgi:hypothetical protein